MTNSPAKDPRLQRLIKLKKEREYRNEQQSVLLEGKNAIFDYAKRHRIKTLVHTEEESIDIDADEIMCVPYHVLEKIASAVTPEGIIAEVAMPTLVSLEKKKRILCLANIQDPGNMGTLLRSALALGFDGAFLVEPCCDPCNDKALRAAKGATFDLALQRGSWQEFQKLAERKGCTIFGADLDGKELQGDIKEPFILILGNEAQGIQAPPYISYKKITLPMHNGVNSLNVTAAGAIFMYILSTHAR
jgi:TrmH family RNA methyltransferase